MERLDKTWLKSEISGLCLPMAQKAERERERERERKREFQQLPPSSLVRRTMF